MDLFERIQAAAFIARVGRRPDATLYALAVAQIVHRAGIERREPTEADAEAYIADALQIVATLPPGEAADAYHQMMVAPLKGLIHQPLEGEALARAVRAAADGADIPVSADEIDRIMVVLDKAEPGRVDREQVLHLLRTGV
jgi:hypothetical protein